MASVKTDLIMNSGAMMDKDCIKVVQSIWLKGMNGKSVPYDSLSSCGVLLGQNYELTDLYCNTIEMRPVQSSTQAAIVATYLRLWCNGGTSDFIEEYDGGVSIDTTNVDINNIPLKVQYFSQRVEQPGADTINGIPGCVGLGDVLTPKLSTVQVPRPVGQLKITKYYDITDDNETALEDLVKKYQGWTNSVFWRGMPKWSWLCSNISVIQATIRQFQVIMQFDWKPLWIGNAISTRRGNWVADCAYMLPEGSGQPPANFQKADVDGFPGQGANGYLMGKVLGSTDFNALGF